jgi:hypothetical protein
MLFHLTPSVEMTGGPWFTDHELDTEFIKQLLGAVLSFIKQRVRLGDLKGSTCCTADLCLLVDDRSPSPR